MTQSKSSTWLHSTINNRWLHHTSAMFLVSLIALVLSGAWGQAADKSAKIAKPFHRAELVFPLNAQHNHAPGIVECPNGDVIVSWYRGSGERKADDVVVLGARKRSGATKWSSEFLMADFPGYPDCNTALFIDSRKRLWLFWPIILANTWESSLTLYRTSTKYQNPGGPRWDWQGLIPLKPENFEALMQKGWEERKQLAPIPESRLKEIEPMQQRIQDKHYSRMGWQPRCKPTQLRSGRILLPLYSDTYSVSIMAISDDHGESWFSSKPLAGFGNIQPTVFERRDGSLIAYMRENGPVDKIRTSESLDNGMTWGPVGASDLPNPGAGVDGVRLKNGNFALIYNDSVQGRNTLAVSISEDEGKTWKYTRHLERHATGSYHYPAIIQGKDGSIHAVYSYFVEGGKSMKYATLNEAWIRGGDSNPSK